MAGEVHAKMFFCEPRHLNLRIKYNFSKNKVFLILPLRVVTSGQNCVLCQLPNIILTGLISWEIFKQDSNGGAGGGCLKTVGENNKRPLFKGCLITKLSDDDDAYLVHQHT